MKKQLKCSQCHRTVEIPDSYRLKCCPLCREKKKAYNLKNSLVRKEMNKLDKEAERQTKGLSNLPKYMGSFSIFQKWFAQTWHRKGMWEDFLAVKEKFRREQAEKEGKIERAKLRNDRVEEKIVNALEYPLVSEDCRTYRLLMAKSKREMEEDEWLGVHLLRCDGCTKWRNWRKYHVSETTLNEGDMSAWDSPNIGADAWGEQNVKELSYEEQVKDKLHGMGFNDDFHQSSDDGKEEDLDRKDFDCSVNEFMKNYKKKKEET